MLSRNEAIELVSNMPHNKIEISTNLHISSITSRYGLLHRFEMNVTYDQLVLRLKSNLIGASQYQSNNFVRSVCRTKIKMNDQ